MRLGFNWKMFINPDPMSKRSYFFKKKKKSHACKEGRAHLRISFLHSLMNLKNKYLLKQLLKWANKKENNFNIYNFEFLKKKQRKTSVDIIIKISMM